MYVFCATEAYTYGHGGTSFYYKELYIFVAFSIFSDVWISAGTDSICRLKTGAGGSRAQPLRLKYDKIFPRSAVCNASCDALRRSKENCEPNV